MQILSVTIEGSCILNQGKGVEVRKLLEKKTVKTVKSVETMRTTKSFLPTI